MKSLIYITAYTNTEKKRDLLRKCINSCKPLNMDIAVVSHSTLPEDIINSVQYYVYDSDNTFNEGNGFIVWKRTDTVKVDIKLNKGKEFPIIKSIRNLLYLAKANGYEFVYGTDFDNEFSAADIQKLIELKRRMIDENKDFIFFYPPDASWEIDGSRVSGIYYDILVTGARLDRFLETFDGYFPRTIEEYNKTMAYITTNKPPILEYYFYDAFKHKQNNTVLITEYVKDYLNTSSINQSTMVPEVINVKILSTLDEQHYLYLTNDGTSYVTFKTYINGIFYREDTLTGTDVVRSFCLIPMTEECSVSVEVYQDNAKIDTMLFEYNKKNHVEYFQNGIVYFYENS